MVSRRDVLKAAGQASLAFGMAPIAHAMTDPGSRRTVRCINFVNFIRGVEPRFATDLLLPISSQMQLLKGASLPVTWLLQYDALVSGPFVPFLKDNVGDGHEVGFWFEMNEMHCRAAGLEWRGRPGYEWDHLPFVAFTIGYSPEERVRLADAAMAKFKDVWGRFPSSVASWNLDAITIEHLAKYYHVDAFAVCRDQIATDGFTIWGAPIAGYYPSRVNAWSPALNRKNQIGAPVFRMLGQDPVYYYDGSFQFPNGERHGSPITMEPVWPSGRSPKFIEEFLRMIESGPSLGVAYAQLGQENSFPWNEQAEGYPLQVEAVKRLREKGAVHVETLGESGRRFKKAFRQTPSQAQVMLDDPYGNTQAPEASVWYQSRFYRANLHFRDRVPTFRDITVYRDDVPQPFLRQATRDHDVEQRMPAVLDGAHWKKDGFAGGRLLVDGREIRLVERPKVVEAEESLLVSLTAESGVVLEVRFEEERIVLRCPRGLAVEFTWDPAKSALKRVEAQAAHYEAGGAAYQLRLVGGTLAATATGFVAKKSGKEMVLLLAQG
ncbi:MAG: hypothetical protein JSS66_17875 [Armatimonadetes bacterium]|nr:hypothetical protein [Armatimonadota bacterium]